MSSRNRQRAALEDKAVVHFKSLPRQSLWSQGTLLVPCISTDENLEKVLTIARRSGHLRGGLEQIQSLLQKEEVGLQNTKQTSFGISRLLIVSNDGSERFYRHCETMLKKYAHRMVCLKINSTSSTLGERYFGAEKSVKAILVARRDSVEKVLLSLFLREQE